MRRNFINMRVIIAALIGAVLGFVGSRILFVGSALSLLPWGFFGLINGIFSRRKKEALMSGVVYGFILSFIFMVAGYNGSRSLLTVIPFFILLGIFGAVCGGVLGMVGFYSKKAKTSVFRLRMKRYK